MQFFSPIRLLVVKIFAFLLYPFLVWLKSHLNFVVLVTLHGIFSRFAIFGIPLPLRINFLEVLTINRYNFKVVWFIACSKLFVLDRGRADSRRNFALYTKKMLDKEKKVSDKNTYEGPHCEH